MYKQSMQISHFVSRLERVSRIYYDRELAFYGIGWAQQYFLLYIESEPGVTPQGVTDKLHGDKGTTAKALKKLYSLGYIDIVSDQRDGRVKHLYITETARPIAVLIKKLLDDFYDITTENFTKEELSCFTQTLDKMTNSIITHLIGKKRKDDANED